MMLFTKIDKKVLIILIAALVVAALIGIAAYKYLTDATPKVQSPVGGVQAEEPDGQNGDTIPQIQIEAEGTNGGGGLSICMDKCGDGICQTSDPYCEEGSLNCICQENSQECPQDCK